MKEKLLAIAIFGLVGAGLSGCVIKVGDDDVNWDSNEKWEKIQQTNRHNLASLNLGMNMEQVQVLMGAADFSEAFIKGDDQINVLFYRTQKTKGDGKTTKDECTPVVLQNNQLIGWGETALSKV